MRVHFQVIEGTRRRTQVFEGIVLRRQGSGARETFTVRKQSFGVGVERTFPLHSPKIEKLEIAARGDVRRAKLYYLRGRIGKAARVAERRWGIDEELISAPAAAAEPEAVDAEGVSQEEAVVAEPCRPRSRRPRRGEEPRRAEAPARMRAATEAEEAAGRASAEEVPRSPTAEEPRPPEDSGDSGEDSGLKLSIPKPQSRAGGLIELVVIVALALGLALAIQAWIVKPYQIPSESMEPTLDVGQRVLVNRFIYHFNDPSIGDIVVFHPPAGADNGTECGVPHSAPRQACPKPTPAESSQNFIKRIVAGPGDTAQRSATATRWSTASRRPTSPTRGPAAIGGACNLPKPITIPPDYYFMMGDNRGASDDSRFWGPVPRKWIIGKAFATYWPPDRIGIL